MNCKESLQNALDNLGLSKEYKLHINYEADKRKGERNRRMYFLTYGMVGTGYMTYNECNHFIFGLSFGLNNK